MEQRFYLGIDNGGTLTKAVLFDAAGHEVAQASESVPLLTPAPGFTERDMEALYAANCRCIRRVAEESGVPAARIAGISCTGHGKGLYLWGRDDRPVCPGIVSTDTRAWEYPRRWREDGTADRAFRKTYQQVLASQQVSLLAWMKDHRPELLDNIRWIFSVKDYIRFRLTGEAYAELTDFSGANLVNLDACGYDRELLALFGLEELFDRLPPLRRSCDRCGRVTAETARLTGLKEGTPVAGGMFDIDACAVAMDVTDEKNLCVIAGTWGINEYVAREPVKNGSVLMNSIFCLPGYYLVEESSPTSAGNHEWFTRMFLQELREEAAAAGLSVYQYADRLAAEAPDGGERIVFLPYLFGSNFNPRARAALVGMDSSHTKGQIIRAVLEGIVFCHMDHIDRLLANRPRPDAIRLAGGAAKSPLWVRLFADVTGLPVEVIDTAELGALGCAMAAAVMAGDYPALRAAAGGMVRVRERVEPDLEKTAAYREKRRAYRKVAQALEPVWGCL